MNVLEIYYIFVRAIIIRTDSSMFFACIQPNLVQSLNAERPKKKLKIDRNVLSCAKTTFWRFACILANISLLFKSVLAR